MNFFFFSRVDVKFLIFILVRIEWHVGTCSEDEERLVRDLFRGYNKLVRPVQNMSMKVEVKFGLTFTQLISVVSLVAFSKKEFSEFYLSFICVLLYPKQQNEKNQVMKSNVWLRLVSQIFPSF